MADGVQAASEEWVKIGSTDLAWTKALDQKEHEAAYRNSAGSYWALRAVEGQDLFYEARLGIVDGLAPQPAPRTSAPLRSGPSA